MDPPPTNVCYSEGLCLVEVLRRVLHELEHSLCFGVATQRKHAAKPPPKGAGAVARRPLRLLRRVRIAPRNRDLPVQQHDLGFDVGLVSALRREGEPDVADVFVVPVHYGTADELPEYCRDELGLGQRLDVLRELLVDVVAVDEAWLALVTDRCTPPDLVAVLSEQDQRVVRSVHSVALAEVLAQ